MPGISFLFKKRFHPQRMDNQKRLFIAEEQAKAHSAREEELAALVRKERELLAYEQLGPSTAASNANSGAGDDSRKYADAALVERDPRNASLKFMYSAPVTVSKNGKERERKDAAALTAPPAPIALDANGDDPAVQAFRRKLFLAMHPATESAATETAFAATQDTQGEADERKGETSAERPAAGRDTEREPEEDEDERRSRSLYPQSQLERESGRRRAVRLTQREQAERHPLLRNAPVEGEYATSLSLAHKPFCAVIRNVRCLRCGEWGHQSGDRECALRNHSRQDYERRQREDPMAALSEKDRERDAESESDPEAEFLQTLTRREKKLLLRKLQELEGIVPSRPAQREEKKRMKKEKKRETKEKRKKKKKKKDTEKDQGKEKERKTRKENEKKSNKRSRSHSDASSESESESDSSLSSSDDSESDSSSSTSSRSRESNERKEAKRRR